MLTRVLAKLGSCSLAVAAILTTTSRAQSIPSSAYVPTMTFDVASVRQSQIEPERGMTVSGGFTPENSGHLQFNNFDTYNLLSAAYGAERSAIEGLPKELTAPFVVFNVEAKSDSASDLKLAALPRDELRLEQEHMVQALLADRFALKAHWETRQGKTYDLVVSKPGKISHAEPPPATESKNWGDRPIPSIYQSGSSMRGFEFIAHGASTADLAAQLTGQFGHPVNDKTGLSGKYDFDLKYYQTHERDRRDDETNPWPPLDIAIQDELGLKLVPSTGDTRVLVIDHIEKPSPN